MTTRKTTAKIDPLPPSPTPHATSPKTGIKPVSRDELQKIAGVMLEVELKRIRDLAEERFAERVAEDKQIRAEMASLRDNLSKLILSMTEQVSEVRVRQDVLSSNLQVLHSSISEFDRKREDQFSAISRDLRLTGQTVAVIEAALERARATAEEAERAFAGEKNRVRRVEESQIKIVDRMAHLEDLSKRMQENAAKEVARQMIANLSPGA